MKIPIKKTLIILLSFMSVVFAIHIILVYLNLYQNIEYPILTARFHLDKEANIPTWFSSFILLLVGISSLLVIFLPSSKDENSQKNNTFWKVFGMVYIFISLDEVSQLHEIVNQFTDTKWIYVYAPFAFFFLLFCLYWLFQKKLEFPLIRNFLLVGMAVQFLGAFVAEYTIYSFQLSPAWYEVEVAFEEGFEMLGTIIVLTGVLIKLNSLTPDDLIKHKSLPNK